MGLIKKDVEQEDPEQQLYQEVVAEMDKAQAADLEAIYGVFHAKGISRAAVDAAWERFHTED